MEKKGRNGDLGSYGFSFMKPRDKDLRGEHPGG